ncbi:MAG: transposase [Desulfobacterales bacterium]|nr:transposase [Deltaproteobacteria bacterium]NNK96072.1 transposase [Desulfobacterales bacterium]
MTNSTEKVCPKCGQRLRYPKNIGGMLMACPSCGHKFHSDFKIGGARKSAQQGILKTVFEMPYKIVCSLSRYLFPK